MAIHHLKEYRFTIEADGADHILRLDGEPLDTYASAAEAQAAATAAAQEIRPGAVLEFQPVADGVLAASLIVKEEA